MMGGRMLFWAQLENFSRAETYLELTAIGESSNLRCASAEYPGMITQSRHLLCGHLTPR
jgi:hypothetical protein